MVCMLKGVWISYLLLEGKESFYRQSHITLVKLHDRWGPKLEMSSLEL
jgi:hypothetical protein